MKSKLQLCISLILMTALILALPGCASKSTMNTANEAAPASAPMPAEDQSATEGQDVSSRMVVRTAGVTEYVDSVEEAAKKLERLVTETGGYIESANVYNEPPSGHYTVRVPESRFLTTLENIKGFGKVQYSSVGGKDVTQEFTDNEARLRNYKRQEEQYLEIMNKATTIEDIIKIENELARIREQIEVLTGRITYLQDQVTMGTIEVDFTQEAGIEESSGPSFGKALSKAKQAAVNSVNMLLNLLAALIVLIGYLIPLTPLIGLGWYGYKKVKQRRAQKSKPKNQKSTDD